MRSAPYPTREPSGWTHDPQRPEPEYIDEKEYRRRERYGHNPRRGFWQVETYRPTDDTWTLHRRLSSVPKRNAVWEAESMLGLGAWGARVVDRETGDVVWQETREREEAHG